MKKPKPFHVYLAEIQQLLNGLIAAGVIEVIIDQKGEVVILNTEPELVYNGE